MRKLRTNKKIELFDKRNVSIGFFVIRLIVNEVSFTNNGAVARGFYYYKNEEEIDVTLDSFATPFAWELIEQAETQLNAFNPNSLKSALLQRTAEFSFLQQQIESGQNWGTVFNDWEIDE